MDMPSQNTGLQEFDDQFDDLAKEDNDLLLDDGMDAELDKLGNGL